jgi:hypothetical protein
VIHLALADVANDLHGYELWLTRAEIAAKSRCSRSTVDRALHNMVGDRYLEVLEVGGGRGNPTRYRFTKPSQNGDVSEPVFDSLEATRSNHKPLHVLEETASFARETASFAKSVNSVNPNNPREKTSGPAPLPPAPDPAELVAKIAEIRSGLSRHPANPPGPSS